MFVWNKQAPIEPDYYWFRRKGCKPRCQYFDSGDLKYYRQHEDCEWCLCPPEHRPTEPAPVTKPCVCGAEFHASFTVSYGESRANYGWMCMCKREGCGWRAIGTTEEEAIANWNYRGEPGKEDIS